VGGRRHPRHRRVEPDAGAGRRRQDRHRGKPARPAARVVCRVRPGQGSPTRGRGPRGEGGVRRRVRRAARPAGAPRGGWPSGPRPFLYLHSQALHLSVGLLIGVLILAVDYRVLASSALPLYVMNLLLLGAVLKIGHTSLGAQRWLSLGPLGQFQPSEIAKLVI